jgi:hypothetical protein
MKRLTLLFLSVCFFTTSVNASELKRCSNKIALFTPIIIALKPFSHGRIIRVLHVYQAARKIALGQEDELSRKQKRRFRKFTRKVNRKCKNKLSTEELAAFIDAKDQAKAYCQDNDPIPNFRKMAKLVKKEVCQD